MELLQLRYFLESAENESFAKTAEKYMVPATSVSAAVKRLERELGCSLFKRTSNRITISDNGKRLHRSLRLIFSELDDAIEELSTVQQDVREIKLLVRAMRGSITDRIIEYKSKHPSISFKTVFDFERADIDDFDIIVDESSDKYASYEQTELACTPVRLRVRSDNPLCGKKLTMKQLSDQPFISIGEGNGLHKILTDACLEAGFTPKIVVMSNDVLCIEKCVSAGVGIGVGREHPGLKPKDGIEYLDVKDFNVKQSVCIFYKKHTAYGNVQHFINFLKSRTSRQ